jgi:hypothetical protein
MRPEARHPACRRATSAAGEEHAQGDRRGGQAGRSSQTGCRSAGVIGVLRVAVIGVLGVLRVAVIGVLRVVLHVVSFAARQIVC